MFWRCMWEEMRGCIDQTIQQIILDAMKIFILMAWDIARQGNMKIQLFLYPHGGSHSHAGSLWQRSRDQEVLWRDREQLAEF